MVTTQQIFDGFPTPQQNRVENFRKAKLAKSIHLAVREDVELLKALHEGWASGLQASHHGGASSRYAGVIWITYFGEIKLDGNVR